MAGLGPALPDKNVWNDQPLFTRNEVVSAKNGGKLRPPLGEIIISS